MRSDYCLFSLRGGEEVGGKERSGGQVEEKVKWKMEVLGQQL